MVTSVPIVTVIPFLYRSHGDPGTGPRRVTVSCVAGVTGEELSERTAPDCSWFDRDDS